MNSINYSRKYLPLTGQMTGIFAVSNNGGDIRDFVWPRWLFASNLF